MEFRFGDSDAVESCAWYALGAKFSSRALAGNQTTSPSGLHLRNSSEVETGTSSTPAGYTPSNASRRRCRTLNPVGCPVKSHVPSRPCFAIEDFAQIQTPASHYSAPRSSRHVNYRIRLDCRASAPQSVHIGLVSIRGES